MPPMRRLAPILLLVLAAGPPAAAGARSPGSADAGLGPVVEEVVAVVEERVVTRTDLELEARVVLVDNGGYEAAFAPLDRATLSSVLDYLVNQMLIVSEAERLRVFEVSADEVAREVDRFARRFPDRATYEAFLTAQDVTADRIAGIFRRDLRVKRYLDSRVKLTVRIGEDEVQAFYEKNGERFGGRTLADVREVIRGYLFKQRYEETVRRLVKELRGRGEVRILTRPDGAPGTPAPTAAAEEGAP